MLRDWNNKRHVRIIPNKKEESQVEESVFVVCKFSCCYVASVSMNSCLLACRIEMF